MRNALVAAATALLVSVGVAGASSTSPFLQVCNQRTGPKESVGDLNVRLTTACAKGQHPFKLALYPVHVAQGPPGPKGDKGDTGAQGPKGNTGATGDTGPQGSKGPRGPKGNNGENGSTGSRGPRGPKGPKGDKGDKGNKGDKGDRGPRGPAGPQGPPGPAGTMSCPSGSTLQKITVTTQGNAKGHEEIWACVVG